LSEALGFEHQIWGFDFYAINGSAMLMSNNSLNYKIIKQRSYKLKFIPFEKINQPFILGYLNLFFDCAYVQNTDILYMSKNNLQNTFLWGLGFGVTFLTYYDKLLRIEYCLNSKLENGFYINFEAAF
jgi:hypothetical protein